MAYIGDENARLRSRPIRERAMTQPEFLSPMVGKPNPELGRVSGPQKVFLLFIAVGFLVLVGLLAYLPSVAAPFK